MYIYFRSQYYNHVNITLPIIISETSLSQTCDLKFGLKDRFGRFSAGAFSVSINKLIFNRYTYVFRVFNSISFE